MTKKLPKIKVVLAVAGLQLTNELTKQFQAGTVKTFGQLWIGKYHLHPGEEEIMIYNDTVKDYIARGILVSRGFVN